MVPIIYMVFVMDGDDYLWNLRRKMRLKKILEERKAKEKSEPKK